MKNAHRFTADLDEYLQRIGSRDPIEAPSGLPRRTLSHIAPTLRAIRARRRLLIARVALAGILSFPLLAGMNVAAAWGVYLALDRTLPHPLAAGMTVMLCVLMLLSLSLAYGSLPLLLGIGLRRAEVVR